MLKQVRGSTTTSRNCASLGYVAMHDSFALIPRLREHQTRVNYQANSRNKFYSIFGITSRIGFGEQIV